MRLKGFGASLKFASQKGKALKKKESILASMEGYSPFKPRNRGFASISCSVFSNFEEEKTQFDQVTRKCIYL